MDKASARQLALSLAALRVALGALAFLLPGAVLRAWPGPEVAREGGGRLLGRSVGARDISLGAGVLLAARHEAPLRGWVEAGMLSDLGDLLATAIFFKELPRLTRWGVLAMTAGAISVGAATSPAVDAGD